MKRMMIANWRRFGGFIILPAQVLSMIFIGSAASGYFVLLWLTLPCGIKQVNDNLWLWIPRQIFFGISGILLINS